MNDRERERERGGRGREMEAKAVERRIGPGASFLPNT
jgi:hypothetical protein